MRELATPWVARLASFSKLLTPGRSNPGLQNSPLRAAFRREAFICGSVFLSLKKHCASESLAPGKLLSCRTDASVNEGERLGQRGLCRIQVEPELVLVG